MIGIGIPSIQSRIPRPMTVSIVSGLQRFRDEERCAAVQSAEAARLHNSGLNRRRAFSKKRCQTGRVAQSAGSSRADCAT